MTTINNSLEASRSEIKRLNDLNSNLVRIMKEKANSERNRKPKKQRNGYIVISTNQTNYTFYFEDERKKHSVSLPCWKVHIQSFYNCSIPFLVVKKEIEQDLIKELKEKLGIEVIYNSLQNATKEKLYQYWQTGENFIFLTNYKQNMKSGYWEMEYWTRGSIQVPEDMR